jgi:4-alpha-glucanotransferase
MLHNKDRKNKNTIFPVKRASGVLLHITSLPGKFGIGDFGDSCFNFIEFLKENNFHLWQVLPLNYPDFSNSPYSSLSAFAGNPLLINLEKLVDFGLISNDSIKTKQKFNDNLVEYRKSYSFKKKILRLSYNNFKRDSIELLNKEYHLFKKNNSFWLDNFSLFMTLYYKFNKKEWNHWPTEYKKKEQFSLINLKDKDLEEIEYYKFEQFLFFYQWLQIKKYANKKSVFIIGDIPIFISQNSADVWQNPKLFLLNADGSPKYVAGVPPDYFSKIGQRWGNPVYNWKTMKKNNFEWWIKRIKHSFTIYDILRIDHFRGFESFWKIPAYEETAIKGEWAKGPGFKFFRILNKHLGNLPIVAEDLGLITSKVEKLREKTGYPSMRVLQFGFDGNIENIHLPNNYNSNCIAYTGTHDNETLIGWFNTQSKEIQKQIKDLLKIKGDKINLEIIEKILYSKAKYILIPLQDLLGLNNNSRLNTPGTTDGNWMWRFSWKQLLNEKIDIVKNSNFKSNRTK